MFEYNKNSSYKSRVKKWFNDNAFEIHEIYESNSYFDIGLMKNSFIDDVLFNFKKSVNDTQTIETYLGNQLVVTYVIDYHYDNVYIKYMNVTLIRNKQLNK